MEKITLCIVPTDGMEMREMEIFNIMSAARREKYAAISNGEMKREYLASSLALHTALTAFTRRVDAALTFRYAETGCPTVDGAHVSLTHTAGAAACAVGAATLGVDIEKHGRQLTEAMRSRLALLPDSPLDDWLARECYLKMTGEGLGGGIDRHRLRDGRISGAYVKFIDAGDYRCAVCCRDDFEIILI